VVTSVAPTRRSAYPKGETFRLLFTDVDSLRHINNVAIARYMAEGRASFNADILTQDLLAEIARGHAFVIARLTIDFLAEAVYPGELEVRTGCAAMGRTSYQLAQGAFQGERCVAAATSIMVYRQEAVSSPVPEELRERLAASMIAKGA
jgi:acyl-CoA thioester hydrolase